MDELLNIMGALSDPGRLRALAALKDGELCVCQIIELLGLAPSTVSKHMFLLRNAGLVESRKEGLWMHYRLPARPAAAQRKALELVLSSLKSDRILAKDKRRLAKIRHSDLHGICRRRRRYPVGKLEAKKAQHKREIDK